MELPKKKNILLIDKISSFNIFFLIFLKIFYDKIFFLDVDKYLRSKKLLLIFEILGISWLNYHQYDLQEVSVKTQKKTPIFCDKYSVYISRKVWVGSLKAFFINKDLFAVSLNSKIYPNILKIHEIMEFGNELRKKNKVTLFTSNNFFFKEINKKYFFKNLNFIIFDIFKVFNFIFLILINIFKNMLKNIFLITIFKKKKVIKHKPKYEEKDYKVAYFPHKGIYGHETLKDQFYLNNINSNFNKKNIAHIEWSYSDINNQDDEYYKNNINNKYYLKNKIPLFFWDTFSYKKKSVITVVNFFLFRFKLIYKFLKFSIFIEVLSSAYHIQNAKEKLLNNFTKLKYVLVGYDHLFPTQISIACKQLGIKTIAVQDRILIPFWTQGMCFDYYFSLGPDSQKILKKRMGKSINFFYSTKVFKENAINIKKIVNTNKLKCLVIDYHSLEKKDWYLNGRRAPNNWSVNFNFYHNILSLSKLHPNISFFIKSKKYHWLTNSYFNDLTKILKKQKNIKILDNQKKWTSKHSINFTDFAIAKYSSLSDQMFYLNKPILILNNHGHPGLVYDFGNKILVNNFNQLKNKISLIEKNYYHFNKSLHSVRKKIFYYKNTKNSLIEIINLFDKKLQKNKL